MRAHCQFEVKGIEEERRTLTGIATTPTVERVSDIVEPSGMVQRGPVGLYLYHKHDLPVGTVSFGKATKDGIPFSAQIPDVQEEGTVKERVKEAWHSIKYGLLRAVSIGFVPNENGYEVMKNGGIRYTDWEILELSLVGVPANPDALITSFKSCDIERQELLRKAMNGAIPLVSAKQQPNLNGAVLLHRPKR